MSLCHNSLRTAVLDTLLTTCQRKQLASKQATYRTMEPTIQQEMSPRQGNPNANPTPPNDPPVQPSAPPAPVFIPALPPPSHGTNDISTLKHFGIMLKDDASNMDSYLYKMEKVLTHKGLMPCAMITFQCEEDGTDEIARMPANPFQDRHMLPDLCALTQQQINEYIDVERLDPKRVEAAHTIVAITLPDTLLHVFRNYPNHAAVTIARIREYFYPTDTKTVHELYNLINHAKMPNYGGDFTRMAEELKNSAHKLHQLGENVTERYLVGRLLDGLVPYSKYTVIRSIIEQQGDIHFDTAVKSIHSYLRSNSLDKKRSPATPEAAMKITDHRKHKDKRNNRKNDYKQKLKNKSALRKLTTKRKRQERYLRQLQDKMKLRKYKNTCNTCGKPGHKSKDCWNNPHRESTCHKCGNKGHLAADCFTGTRPATRRRSDRLNSLYEELASIKEHLRKTHENKSNLHNEDESCPDPTHLPETLKMMTDDKGKDSSPSPNIKVIFDSGASTMFFNDKKLFKNLTPISPRKILTGKQGSFMTSTHQGDVPLILRNENGTPFHLLVKALYVPKAPENYFSQLAIDRLGFETRCKGGKIRLFTQAALSDPPPAKIRISLGVPAGPSRHSKRSRITKKHFFTCVAGVWRPPGLKISPNSALFAQETTQL